MASKISDDDGVAANISSNANSSGEDSTASLCLHWGDVSIIGREDEARILKAAISRLSNSAQAQAILIHGLSGSGKSALVKTVLKDEVSKPENGLFWITGKCDQNAGTSSPFRVVVDATTELCYAIQESQYCSRIISNVQDRLGEDDLQILSTVVPVVGLLFPHLADEIQVAFPSMNESTLIRFVGIFRRFFNAVSSTKTPIVLFLDDLQWIHSDDASHNLLLSLFKDTKMSSLLLIGAIRDEEATTFEAPKDSVMTVHKITCVPLDEDSVTDIVAKATGNDASETQELGALVHSRTQGNPYFVKQFLESLLRNGTMTFNADVGKFEWDCATIAAKSDPTANVVQLMVENITTLPYNSQLVLVIAATLGHTFKSDVLEALLASVELLSQCSSILLKDGTPEESSIDLLSETDIVSALQNACKAKLLLPTGAENQFRFSHDRVQQSALSLLPQGNQGTDIKSTLGSLMLELSRSNKSEDWMIYSACNLLIENGSRELKPRMIAEVALEASKRSASQAAFRSAAQYADSGVSLLGRRAWQTNYALCLELYTISAEAHYSNGSLKACKKKVKLIKKFATKEEDRFRAQHVLLDTLSGQDDWEGSTQEALDCLKAIGVTGLNKPSMMAVMFQFMRSKRLLKGRRATDLKSLPDMVDPIKKEIVELLASCCTSAYMGGIDNCSLVAALMAFQRTLQYGMSQQGPFVIALYGYTLAHLGDVQQAHEYGLVALELTQRAGLERSIAPVHNVVHSTLWHLKGPMRDSPGDMTYASKMGLNKGNPLQGFISKRFATVYPVFVGHSLRTYEEEMIKSCDSLREYKQKGQLAVLLPWAQFVENIRGKTPENPTRLIGSHLDEREVVRRFEASDKKVVLNRHAVLITHYARMMLLYVCGKHHEAEEDRKKYASVEGEPSTYVIKLLHYFFAALNCYAMAITTGKKVFCSRANKYVKLIKSYGKAGSPNTPPMLELLDAEFLTFKGKTAVAATKYVAAIHMFKEGEFYMFEAIAYERAGHALKGFDSSNSENCMKTAYEKYEAYGADLKVSLMRDDALSL